MTVNKSARRTRALQRLQAQLASGKKNTREGIKELDNKDIARINREIEILQR